MPQAFGPDGIKMSDAQLARLEERKTTMKHADVPFMIDFHTHMLDEELRAICTSHNELHPVDRRDRTVWAM